MLFGLLPAIQLTANAVALTNTSATLTGGNYEFTAITVAPNATITKAYSNTDALPDGIVWNFTTLVAGDAGNVTLDASGLKYSEKNVKDNIALTGKLALSGTAAGNYNLTTQASDLTGNITKQNITGLKAVESASSQGAPTAATFVDTSTATGIVTGESLANVYGKVTWAPPPTSMLRRTAAWKSR